MCRLDALIEVALICECSCKLHPEGENDGRNSTKVLPRKDKNGKKIEYREYDINSHPQHGAGRGLERMVIGSDGRAYYTREHYKTFEEFKY